MIVLNMIADTLVKEQERRSTLTTFLAKSYISTHEYQRPVGADGELWRLSLGRDIAESLLLLLYLWVSAVSV